MSLLFHGDERFQKGHPFPGAHWQWVFQSNAVQQTDTYGQVDERLHYTYGAIYTSPALGMMKAGPGGNYVQAFKDKDGNRLDGGKSYRLHVPAKAPAAAFWSITLYDTATRSQIQNAINDAARSSLDKLQDECRRLDRPLLRPQVAGGEGEQLGPDASRQGLVPDVPLLHPDGGAVRRDVEVGGHRVDEVRRFGHSRERAIVTTSMVHTS